MSFSLRLLSNFHSEIFLFELFSFNNSIRKTTRSENKVNSQLENHSFNLSGNKLFR